MQLTWDRVLAWRLRRHFVAPRRDVGVVEIVTRLCGVQAQVASAADLAVRLRQRAGRNRGTDGIDAALTNRELVKTWAMRGTLHVLSSAEGPAFLSLVASARTWERPSWQKTFGATSKQIAALGERVAEILDNTILTRAELIEAVTANRPFKSMRKQLQSGWGTLLKPLAWQGLLCHGPNRGSNVTFTRPDTYVPGWTKPPEPEAAAPIAVAAYLRAYAPATPEAFGEWLMRSNVTKTTLRRWFASLGDEVTTVDVEGRKAYARTEDLDELMRTKPSSAVRLFGPFDQYVLGPTTRATELLAREHRGKVSKTAGWIAPIVVVGGRITGVWELTDDAVVVTMFPGEPEPPAKELDAEVAHVARVTGRDALAVRVT